MAQRTTSLIRSGEDSLIQPGETSLIRTGGPASAAPIFKPESPMEIQLRRLRDIQSDVRVFGMQWRPLRNHKVHISNHTYEILCSNCRVDIMKQGSHFCENRYENCGIFEPWCRKEVRSLSQLSRGAIQAALASSAYPGESLTPRVLQWDLPPHIRDAIFLDTFAREFSGNLYAHLKEGEIRFIPKIRKFSLSGETIYPSAAEVAAIISQRVKDNAAKYTCNCPTHYGSMEGYAVERSISYQAAIRHLRMEPVVLIDRAYLDNILRANEWY